MNDDQHLTEAEESAIRAIKEMSKTLATTPDNVFQDQMRTFIEMRKMKPGSPSIKKAASARFKDLFDNGKDLKLRPFRIDPPTEIKEYPEIKNMASKVTVNDLIAAAKDWSAMEGSLYMRMVYDIMRKSDKACFDCFREYLGCQNADDVFTIMTSPTLFHRYNDIVPLINQRIAEYLNLSGIGFGIGFLGYETTDKPADGCGEALERLRGRWEEIYNEEETA